MSEHGDFIDRDSSNEPLEAFTIPEPLLTKDGGIDRARLNPTQLAAIEAGPGWIGQPAEQDQFPNPMLAHLQEHRLFTNFPAFFLPDAEGENTTFIGGEPENIPSKNFQPNSVGGGDVRRLLSPPYQRFAILYPDFCEYMFKTVAKFRQKTAEHAIDWLLDNEETYNQAVLQAYNVMSRLVSQREPHLKVETEEGPHDDRRYLVR